VIAASFFHDDTTDTGQESHAAKKGMYVDKDFNGVFHGEVILWNKDVNEACIKEMKTTQLWFLATELVFGSI